MGWITELISLILNCSMITHYDIMKARMIFASRAVANSVCHKFVSKGHGE